MEKKPYKKPKIRVVELRAEQTLTSGCQSTADTPAGELSGPCSELVCFAPGS
ncbi:MAG: hypothetical protein AAF654_04930 [Myxococcota bacterium]